MKYLTIVVSAIGFLIIFNVMVITMCTSADNNKVSVCFNDLIPKEINGWKIDGEIEIYNRETIFKYMDGAGEIYRMYGFRRLEVLHLAKPNASVITVELFDMSDPEEAFGVFSHMRESDDAGVGEGSEYREGLLCFWQGKFFICISAEQETPEVKQLLFDLSEKLIAGIKKAGTRPKILKLLPQENLIAGSVRYFHLFSSLNYHYFLASENILNLNEQTDAFLAEYQPGRFYLLCIRYPDEFLAKEAYNSFLSSYLPEAEKPGIYQVEKNKWVASEQAGLYIIIVFDAPDQSVANELIQTVKLNIPEQNL